MTTTPPPTRCETLLSQSLDHAFVRFLREKTLELGCSTDAPSFSFACAPCENKTLVGFFTDGKHTAALPVVASVKRGVVICEDNVDEFKLTRDHVQRTVSHELIHAYDVCRARVDYDNCQHVACTEIRAALLSGDCDFANEVLVRRQLGFKAQGAACARRRAEISVAAHPSCGEKKAKEAVDAVFDRCYADTAPFEAKF